MLKIATSTTFKSITSFNSTVFMFPGAKGQGNIALLLPLILGSIKGTQQSVNHSIYQWLVHVQCWHVNASETYNIVTTLSVFIFHANHQLSNNFYCKTFNLIFNNFIAKNVNNYRNNYATFWSKFIVRGPEELLGLLNLSNWIELNWTLRRMILMFSLSIRRMSSIRFSIQDCLSTRC